MAQLALVSDRAVAYAVPLTYRSTVYVRRSGPTPLIVGCLCIGMQYMTQFAVGKDMTHSLRHIPIYPDRNLHTGRHIDKVIV